MPSNDTTTAQQQHVGLTAEFVIEPERVTVGTLLPECNRGNRCPWSEESRANGWRETCRQCGRKAQGSGQ